MRTKETTSDVLGRNRAMEENLRTELMGQTAALARAAGRLEKLKLQLGEMDGLITDGDKGRVDFHSHVIKMLQTIDAPDEEWDKAQAELAAQRAVHVLNEIFAVDKTAIELLFNYGVKISDDGLWNHPTCPVDSERTISALGMVNTVLRAVTGGRNADICTCWSADSSGTPAKLVRFDIFKPRDPRIIKRAGNDGNEVLLPKE